MTERRSVIIWGWVGEQGGVELRDYKKEDKKTSGGMFRITFLMVTVVSSVYTHVQTYKLSNCIF